MSDGVNTLVLRIERCADSAAPGELPLGISKGRHASLGKMLLVHAMISLLWGHFDE